jgi:hypothetical protein
MISKETEGLSVRGLIKYKEYKEGQVGSRWANRSMAAASWWRTRATL